MEDLDNKQFVVDDKAYSEDELYQIGKLHFPKRYWIKRGTGLALWYVALNYGISTPFSIYYALKWGGAAAIIGVILILLPFVALLVAGTIVFALSFKPEAREVYVEYAKKYLTNIDLRTKARASRAERNRQAYNLKMRVRYKKLLDKGVISQEEYESKIKEFQ